MKHGDDQCHFIETVLLGGNQYVKVIEQGHNVLLWLLLVQKFVVLHDVGQKTVYRVPVCLLFDY